MTRPIADLGELLRSLRPVRHPGVYVHGRLDEGRRAEDLPVVAWIREPEGLT